MVFLCRFPVVTWRHQRTKAVLLRASGFHAKGMMGMFKGHHSNPSTSKYLELTAARIYSTLCQLLKLQLCRWRIGIKTIEISPQVQHRVQSRWRPLVWNRRSTSQLWFQRHLWGRSTRIPQWATPWRASTPSSCRRRAVTGWWYRTPRTPWGGTPTPSPGLLQRWEAVVVRWNVCMQRAYQLVNFNIDYFLSLLLSLK